MLQRALGDDGLRASSSRSAASAESYTLTPVQADAILRMTLGQLVNLEQEKLGDEHRKLLDEIAEYLRILSDEQNILDIIRDDLPELKRKHGDARRTEISGEEIGDDRPGRPDHRRDDGRLDQPATATSSARRPAPIAPSAAAARASRAPRPRKKIRSSTCSSPARTTTCCSSPTRARSTGRRSTTCRSWRRDSRGRAVVNLLNLAEGEKIADCRAVRDFDQPDHYLMMATRKGLVKKTPLDAYSRPLKGGIIAIKLREDDELVDVVDHQAGRRGGAGHRARAWRSASAKSDARPMGRNTSGVKGITLAGRRRAGRHGRGRSRRDAADRLRQRLRQTDALRPQHGGARRADAAGERPWTTKPATRNPSTEAAVAEEPAAEEDEGDEESSSSQRYRTQRRGGKGLRDIKTTDRNGPVIGIVRVHDDDELLMMTARGKIQRIAASDISIIGRNTQGRADHEPRRRRHPGRRRPRAQGGTGRSRTDRRVG